MPMPFVNPRDTTVFADIANIYGLPATEEFAAGILSALDLKMTVVICGRLNAIISGIGNLSTERRNALAMKFLAVPKEERRILNFVGPRGGYERRPVFFRGQLLELMRLAVKYCRKEPFPTCYDDPKNRSQFLKAALIASSLWTARVLPSRFDINQINEENISEHLGYLRKIIEETNPAPAAINTIGRGWLLFSEYLPKRYPGFEAEFLAATDMTYDQYSTCVTGLLLYIMVGNELEGRMLNVNSVGAATTYRGVFPNYLALDTQTLEQFAKASQGSQAEFEKAMWQRPIILFPNGDSVISDPVFFSAKLSIGPLFFLLRNHPERGSAVFAAFGHAFEDYVNAIVGRMFANAHFNLEKADGKNTDFEVDALASEGSAALVFEAKAKFLKEELVSGNEYADFVGHLREKYISPRNAVWQLAKSTASVSARAWPELPPEFEETTEIFPIVITHDIRMDSPGTGLFFRNEMKALSFNGANQDNVRPLVIMTVQDLESVEASIAASEFTLTAFLTEYLAEIQNIDPLCSLHNFIAHSKYNSQLRPSPIVFQKSLEVLDRARLVLFPKADAAAPSPGNLPSTR
jgi:hypothetical protein